ncbi:hypothetical protein RIVM261_001150 [Rivularia sp. IAM M-261]|nr:hypothetical protein CAL7716_053840 [Calothrix sp. PCC 7716]GJD15159.1 hypothetical protein RIVM261_001150 [Rivularia sp. IAM M-261]
MVVQTKKIKPHTKPQIHDLTLAIPGGKITALVGANGCGKSTLLRGLARLLKPQTGAVYIDSAAMNKDNPNVMLSKQH